MATSLMKLKVGVTFLIALLALLAGIIWLKEYDPTADTRQMRVLFDNANGITTGDPVTVAGIKVGEVREVVLTDGNRAMVSFSLLDRVDLRPDAVFRVVDIGVMGDKALVIEPGTARGRLDTNAVQPGGQAAGLESLISDARDVLGDLRNITAEVDSELDVARLTAGFEETLFRVQRLSREYENIAIRNRDTLEASLRNMEALSGDVRAFVEANDTEAARALERFRIASERMAELAESLRPLGEVADTLAWRFRTGEGTLARLITTDTLHEDLRATSALLDSLIVDIRRNPGRYTRDIQFKFELF